MGNMVAVSGCSHSLYLDVVPWHASLYGLIPCWSIGMYVRWYRRGVWRLHFATPGSVRVCGHVSEGMCARRGAGPDGS